MFHPTREEIGEFLGTKADLVGHAIWLFAKQTNFRGS